jgi:hypothetical protein
MAQIAPKQRNLTPRDDLGRLKTYGVMEQWSNGILGSKADEDLFDSQPYTFHKNCSKSTKPSTPTLQHSNTP